MGKSMQRTFWLSLCLGLGLFALTTTQAQQPAAYDVKAHYDKTEHQIAVRDGKRLFTVVYTPKDRSQKYPMLMERTPYSAGPYGADAFKRTLGPSAKFAPEGYIFVYQDVRGTFLSEGEFEDVRPFNPNKRKPNDIDEASDTYDTVEWLLKNIPNHNGRVGVYGISYPGFYTTMAALADHPAIKAVSPQAPVTNWFIGDDDHRNGALFLFDAFNFNMMFGMPRPEPTQMQWRSWSMNPPNAYEFFLQMGPVANAQRDYFKGKNKYWNDVTTHGTYNAFWQARTPEPHLRARKQKSWPAIMTVGGWFDAEDLYGALATYRNLEANQARLKNTLVMGPWCHGCWTGSADSLGHIRFGAKTGLWYQDKLELPFFDFYLKGKGAFRETANGADVWAFRTGANEWKNFAQWPPVNRQIKPLYLQANGKLAFAAPAETKEAFDEYVSDPAKPVPYSATITNRRGSGYMIEDQRFAAARADVLTYSSDALTESLTLAGPINTELYVSTTGTDADFVVKVIDVYPDDAPSEMGGFQMLVRAEAMRGKFRNSLSKPEPFKPGQPTLVKITLQDVYHTFQPGHKIMVQVQSSWFPLMDRNPQKFVDIYHCAESDFQSATHRIYRSGKLASRLQVGLLK
jgi:hypothetical protein